MKQFDLNYKILGTGKTILYLHGWGRSMEDYNDIIELLPNYRHILIDLPGFGKSREPIAGLRVEDVVEIIKEFIEFHQVKVDLIIGHSYGGKVGFIYSINNGNIPLILCSPSLIKPRFSIKKYFKIKHYKFLKFLYRLHIIKKIPNSGSKDYQNSSGTMRATLVKAVNSYYHSELKKFTGKIILFWGKNDSATPLYQAKKIERLSKNCQLNVNDGDHFSFIKYRYQFIKLIENELSNL